MKNDSDIMKKMIYTCHYETPLGTVLLVAEDNALIGLWFEGQKHFASLLKGPDEEKSLPVFEETVRWLDLYFAGKDPFFLPKLKLKGTVFQKEVWEILLQIPYGKTVSYSQIAEQIAKKKGIDRMSAQAVGNAVGRNPISLIVPCHRVIGSKGEMTGYAGGIDRKRALLKLEMNNEK